MRMHAWRVYACLCMPHACVCMRMHAYACVCMRACPLLCMHMHVYKVHLFYPRFISNGQGFIIDLFQPTMSLRNPAELLGQKSSGSPGSEIHGIGHGCAEISEILRI